MDDLSADDLSVDYLSVQRVKLCFPSGVPNKDVFRTGGRGGSVGDTLAAAEIIKHLADGRYRFYRLLMCLVLAFMNWESCMRDRRSRMVNVQTVLLATIQHRSISSEF